MSKSHQQFLPQKSVLSALQRHSRTRSNRFLEDKVPMESLLAKGKEHYHEKRVEQACACFQQVWTQMKSPTPEVAYLLGLTLMGVQNYPKAIPCFEYLESKYPFYKQTINMLLSICYSKTNSITKAQHYISLQNQQAKSIESLFFGGKLAMRQNNYEQAFRYLTEVLNLDGNHQMAKLYSCQCLQKLERSEQCLKFIEDYLRGTQNNDNMTEKMKYIKVSCLIQEKKFVLAEQELDLMEKMHERTSEILFYKAKIYRSKYAQQKCSEFVNQEILLLTELLEKSNSSKKLSWSALSQLILIHMRMKDFYEALHYTKRAVYLKLEDSALMSGLTKSVEGITFLMKKKFTEAITMIESAEVSAWQGHQDVGFLKDLYWNSLGYGYFCLGEHQTALDMYNKVKESDEELMRSSLYNICLCEGILEQGKGNSEEAIKRFQTATDHLVRPEPYFYICVILVLKNLGEGNISDILMKVLNIIDAGLRVGENSQMYYYRGLIYLYLGMNSEAIDDVDKAIEKSEDNIAKYFYLRALIFMHERNYQQAIAQFSTCISIDEKFYEGYLQRAKAKLLFGDRDGALEDLAVYPLGEEWKPLFNLFLGNYQDIVVQKVADENIGHIANFQLGNFQEGGPAGKIIYALIHKNYEQVLQLLNEAIDINFPVSCLQVEDLHILRGFCFFKMQKYEKCLENLLKSQESVNKQQNSMPYHEEDEKKLLLIKINIILVTLCQGNKKDAAELCNSLINDVYEGPIYDELLKLYHYLSDSITTLEFKLFKESRMISDEWQKQTFQGLVFQFYMMYPKVRILDIQVPPCEQPLIDFTLKDIENRAQAPWIRKNQMGIMFTNQIQHFQDLNLNTEENQLEKSEKQRIKQSLQLDAEVVNKLERFSLA